MSLKEFKPSYFQISEQDDVVVGKFSVPHLTDDQNIEMLGHELFALVEQFECRKIVLSLKTVQYLTSSVIGKLITLHRKIHRNQGQLVLCDLQPEVLRILSLSRLLDYFKTTESLEQAITLIQST